jgi:YebC/PmpR family DNA-binding regulatory protein
MVAARGGGADLNANPRLRLAVDKAKAANMPADTIKRNIDKATGNLDGVSYEEIRYEGYGIGGAAVIVDCMTDNKVRTVAEVRHCFNKNGGNLGETGSVAFMFDRVGQIVYPPAVGSEDDVMEAAIEAGAEDAESDAESHVITTAFEDMNAVLEVLEGRFGPAKSTSIIWKPKSSNPVAGDDVATLFKLIDALDDDDDVQNVYGNYDMSDEDLAKYAG